MKITTEQLFILGVLLRIGFFLFGLFQDKYMAVRYTDIDYVVFSDAAKYVADDKSPYQRETYRYTPMLAWILLPVTFGGNWVHYGKAVFMLCDIITGALITEVLKKETPGSSTKDTFFQRNKTTVLSAIWLLNPMVITISTRGSSESVLSCFIMLAVANLFRDQYIMSALFLGLSIHFKIYPIIYLPSIMLFLASKKPLLIKAWQNVPFLGWVNTTNLTYLVATLASFAVPTYLMYDFYGYEFLYHSYLYHLTRLDHRHNFSLYNLALYLKSARDHLPQSLDSENLLTIALQSIEKAAFAPQIILSGLVIPLVLARRNLTACFFIQTLTFVTFNKVMTSQYFIWFLIFLPSYLATSQLLSKLNARKGSLMLLLWIASQGMWLLFAYKLEFLGESTFTELLFSSSIFFLVNCWLIGEFIALA